MLNPVKDRTTFLAIFEGFALTKKDLVNQTGMSFSQVSSSVGRLADAGLVVSHDVNSEAQGSRRQGQYKELVWQSATISIDDSDVADAEKLLAATISDSNPTKSKEDTSMATKNSRNSLRRATPVNRYESKEDTSMATKTSKRSTKSTTPKATAKAETTPKTRGRAPKFAPTAADVKAIAKRLRDGEKFSDVRDSFDLSNGQPVRRALYAAGFDTKGKSNPDGKTAREQRANGSTPKASKAKASKATPKAKATKTTTKRRATKADPS